MTRSSITPKQKQILLYLYKFRFLNTHQIRSLLSHKNTNRIQPWLKDLANKGYIGMKYQREKRIENTKPAIYHLATKSIRVLKSEEECDASFLERIYKEVGRKDLFIQHCLFMADMYLFFLSQKEEGEDLHFFTKSGLNSYEYLPKNLPDAYINLKTKTGVRRYFLDLFDTATRSIIIKNRVKEYLKYSKDYQWETATDSPLPIILLVFPDEIMKNHALYYTRAKLKKEFDDKTSFFLTTTNAIYHPQDLSNIWQKVA